MVREYLNKSRIAFSISSLVLAGCAGSNLTTEVNKVAPPFKVRDDANERPIVDLAGDKAVTLGNATAYAYSMSEAFRSAGNQSASMQDALSFLVASAAAATVIGAIDEISEERLARTAVTGTALFSLQRTGLSQSDIDALYVGAQQSNCIALSSAIRQSSSSKNSFDALVTIFYVREVELRARLSLVNDVVSFEEFVALFRTATASLVGGRIEGISSDPYITTLDKCLEISAPDRSDNPQQNDEADVGDTQVETADVRIGENNVLPEGAADAAAAIAAQ